MRLNLNLKAWNRSFHSGSSILDLIQSLATARGVLLKELVNISKAIGHKIDDLSDSQVFEDDYGAKKMEVLDLNFCLDEVVIELEIHVIHLVALSEIEWFCRLCK